MKKESDLSRLMHYAGNHKYLTYASWILSVISAFTALVPFIYIWKIIRDVLNYAPNFSEAQNITAYGIYAVVFSVISVLVYIAGLMCSHIAAFRVAANMRKECMKNIASMPIGTAESFGSGKLRKIVLDSTAATETYLAHSLPDKAKAVATPIGLLALLIFFDWRLGLLSLIPVALAFIIMNKMTGKRMESKMKEYQDALTDMSNEAVEYIRGIPVVKTFGQTVFSFKRFKDSIERYKKWVIEYTKALRMPMMCYTTAINSVFAFLIAGGILLSVHGITTQLILNLLFYVIITPVISTTLTKMMFMSEDTLIVKDAIQRFDSISCNNPSAAKESPDIKDNSIVLKNVCYSYDGNKDAVHNVSLSIKPGETAAFVGPSGGGKSTLAGIISGFYPPQSGSVLIGGTDEKNINNGDLMNMISFVFQNSKLIKASILDNVRMAKPDASRNEVIAALKTAQCEDIIEKLPNGIDTVIGTKGVYLSGGEQQRIAIARAVLKNSPILILDEATAFADPDNEALVQKAFENMTDGKTVIMISHRLTTVKNTDKIYLMKDGAIKESGTHDELIAAGGLYNKMWNEYQTSVSWKVNSNEGSKLQ